MGFTTLALLAGGAGGSSLEHPKENKKNPKQTSITDVEIFMIPSFGRSKKIIFHKSCCQSIREGEIRESYQNRQP
jgi:hypothetical protein